MDINLPHPASFGSDVVSVEYEAEVPYTALWYQNGTYYRGVNATFPMYQQPMGIYRAQVNKTFLVWMNGQSPAWATVVVFNHTTGVFEGVKKVFQMPNTDGHRSPSLHIDGSGFLYIFGGSHGDATKVWKSNAAYDTANWTQKASITGPTTYPQPHELTAGEITVFHRQGSVWGYVQSSNGFATAPSAFTSVVASPDLVDGVYALTRSEGATVHMIWTVLDSDTQIRKHIWYAKSEDGGSNWTRANGTAYMLPIDAHAGEKIFDSGSEQVNLQDLQIDPNGDVVAMFSRGTIGEAWSYKVARFDGAWDVATIPAAADRQFDCGALIVESATALRAILPSAPGQAGEDGGNIEDWRSSDGGATWTLHATLTADPFNHNNVKAVRDADPDLVAFWGYGDAPTNTPGHLKFLSDSQGVDAIRPGNPFKRVVKVTRNGTVLWNAPLTDGQNNVVVRLSQGAFSARAESMP